MTTRFMQVMFSNTDEDAAKQVDSDIKKAQEDGVVEDPVNNLKYENVGDGNVAITDKENGQVTLAKKATDTADTYDLVAVPDGNLERFLHPSADGIHNEGPQLGAPDEKVSNHFGGGEPAPAPVVDDEQKEFSVYSDNTVVQKIFSDQEFCERIFSEVLESGEEATVGNLKVENVGDEEPELKVTDTDSEDSATVKYDNDGNLIIDEKVTTKNCSNVEQYEPLRIVGVDEIDHVLVDAPAYTEEAANELAGRLTEDGVAHVQIFDNQEDARDYAIQLLTGLGVNSTDDVEEPQQAQYSETGDEIYLTHYYSDNTYTQVRYFSESVDGLTNLHDTVMDAISSGDQVETDTEVVTPIDAVTGLIEEKATGETSLATVDGTDVEIEKIEKDKAQDLTNNLSVVETEARHDGPCDEEKDIEEGYMPEEECEDGECDQKECSDIYTDDTETRFFSENEPMTDYMIRLFSAESDQNAVEDAIANGDQIETDTEVITPIDSKTAIVDDKVNPNDNPVKVTILDENRLNVHPISKNDADELTENLSAAPGKDEENALAEEKGEIKNYSDIYTDEAETRFFSENEPMNNYMIRLFSEESDQDAIEDAIANGDQIETETETITPIDSKRAVIYDKDVEDDGDNDEDDQKYTLATILDDDQIDVHPIDEDTAEELTDNLDVEDTDKDEDEPEEKEDDKDKSDEEKSFSDPNSTLEKFFADAVGVAAPAPATVPAQAAPAPVQAVDQNGNPVAVVADPNAQAPAPAPTVEDVEDKAAAAVQSIKAAAEDAAATIMDAKAAPAPNAEPSLEEAQFSEKTFSANDTLISWLNNK